MNDFLYCSFSVFFERYDLHPTCRLAQACSAYPGLQFESGMRACSVCYGPRFEKYITNFPVCDGQDGNFFKYGINGSQST